MSLKGKVKTMKTTIISTAITTILVIFGSGYVFAQRQQRPRANQQNHSRVFINGVGLTSDVVAAIERAAGARVPSGRYWYDPYCGAWGKEGGPTLGFGQAGIDFGTRMSANASNGHTGTFINGRELPYQDVASLNNLIAPSRVLPGRFLLDAFGNAGYEGRPALGDFVQTA